MHQPTHYPGYSVHAIVNNFCWAGIRVSPNERANRLRPYHLLMPSSHTPPRPAAQTAETGIVEQIYEAVIEQRLLPGTKLPEAELCEAFGVGRMHIRRALLLLANRDVVELKANRGAFVAQPTAKQARDVFEARHALEPTVAELATQRRTRAGLATLHKHLLNESAAHNQGNRREAIRLSGQFHIALADVAANQVMSRLVKNLVIRSSLIIGMYGQAAGHTCRDDEHAGILQAMRSKNAELAAHLMRAHLQHIFENLNLASRVGNRADLVTLFRPCDHPSP